MSRADLFLKIEGIKGESGDDKHKDEIEIESWSWGVSNAQNAAGGGQGTGKANIGDISFATRFGLASPKLAHSCAMGKHIPTAVLICRKTGAGDEPLEFLKITLTDIVVSSYQTGSSGSDSVPIDSFSLNFVKVKMEYSKQGEKGGAEGKAMAEYDVRANKAAAG